MIYDTQSDNYVEYQSDSEWQDSPYTLPAISLAPPELLCSISHMLNKTITSTDKLYIF
jgi:hypothetical protein